MNWVQARSTRNLLAMRQQSYNLTLVGKKNSNQNNKMKSNKCFMYRHSLLPPHMNFSDPAVHVNLKNCKGFQMEITNKAPPTRWRHAALVPAGMQSRVRSRRRLQTGNMRAGLDTCSTLLWLLAFILSSPLAEGSSS